LTCRPTGCSGTRRTPAEVSGETVFRIWKGTFILKVIFVAVQSKCSVPSNLL
jgi:hypothetical protein